MQFGSDGVTACATCHFNSGGDNRFVNQINPGSAVWTSTAFPRPIPILSLYPFSANHYLTASDFPLHKLTDIDNSGSAVISDNNNIVGSQGVYNNVFNDVIHGPGRRKPDACSR